MVTGDMNTHHVSMATASIFVVVCRPATGRPVPRPARAKDLHVRKVKFYLHIGPYRPAAGRQGTGRPPTGR